MALFAQKKIEIKPVPPTTLLLMLLLFAALVFTAFAIIYVKHLERGYYHQLQVLQREEHQLYIEKNQLLLEYSTWAAPARVQSMAKLHFDMQLPPASRVVMVPR